MIGIWILSLGKIRLSGPEPPFSRSCSLTRLQPLQKRDSRVEQHDLSRPGGDQIRRIWPIFEVFPAARAPAAARDPRNRPTPAPETRDGRPAPGAGASGARGVPAGRKGPIFSAPGVRVGQQVSEEAPAARAGMLLATGHCENGARRSTPRVTRTIKPATKAVPTSATSFMNALGPKHTHLRRAPWRRRAAARRRAPPAPLRTLVGQP